MSSKKTSKLNLHAWVGSDPFKMDEFNENFKKIDQAVADNADALEGKADADTVSALQSALEEKADKTELDAKADSSTVAELAQYPMKFYKSSYPGKGTNGKNSPTKITFPFTPKIVLLNGGDNVSGISTSTSCAIIIWGFTAKLAYSGALNTISYDGNTMSWYIEGGSPIIQYNQLGTTYHYVAFG